VFSVRFEICLLKLTLTIDKKCKFILHCRKLGVPYNFEINCTVASNKFWSSMLFQNLVRSRPPRFIRDASLMNLGGRGLDCHKLKKIDN
jgi:hypothetical protein